MYKMHLSRQTEFGPDMDWQVTPPAAGINRLFSPSLVERSRPADQYRLPSLPGEWVDHHADRQAYIEDIEQFRRFTKPSVPLRIVRALSCAKRRCTQAAAGLYQRGVRLYEVVRDCRRAQASKRRRPCQTPHPLPPHTPIQPSHLSSAMPPDPSHSTKPRQMLRQSMVGYIRSSTLFGTFNTKHETAESPALKNEHKKAAPVAGSEHPRIQDRASTPRDAKNKVTNSSSGERSSTRSTSDENNDWPQQEMVLETPPNQNESRGQDPIEEPRGLTFEEAYRHILQPRSETRIKEEDVESLAPLERLCIELRDQNLGGKQMHWYDEEDAKPYRVSAETLTRRDARKAAKRAEEAKKAREERERQISQKSKIVPLSREWEHKVQEAVKHGHAPNFTATDFARVIPPPKSGTSGRWLNDESINGYLKLATAHYNALHPSATPKCVSFTSFMFESIQKKGYKGVERWAKRAKIGGAKLLETDTILIPVNSSMHWTLMAVHPGRRVAHYYDSMSSGLNGGKRFFELLRIWLRGELGDLFVESDWTFEQKQSPQQNNAYDCGVFSITTAKMLILGAEVMSYGWEDIPTQRQRIVAELVNGAFL